MFVLNNAWAQLARHRWRTLLTAIITMVVAFGALFGLSVGQANTTATTDDYELLAPKAVVRMTADQLAKRDGADPDWTKHYLTLDDYNTYYETVTNAGIQIAGMNLAMSVPARQTDDSIKAIAGTDDQDADKTGGEFTVAAFTSVDTARDNELGAYKVVEGKHLSYSGKAPQGALISRALADANGLKVGDEFTVADPGDADTTHTLTVRGIYEYTDEAPAGHGDDAALAKDNRDNAIYVAYATLYDTDMAKEDGTGWNIPDMSYVFEFSSMSDYDTFATQSAKSIAKGYEVSSPTLTAYERQIAPLTSLNATMGTVGLVLWIGGGLLLLALTLLGVARRAGEIGTALVCGMTRGRLAWQFMLEVFLPMLAGLIVGIVAGGFAAGPLGTALAGGYQTTMDGSMIWHVTWIGLLATLVLAIVAAMRPVCFGTTALFRRADDAVAADTADGDVADADMTDAGDADAGDADAAGEPATGKEATA